MRNQPFDNLFLEFANAENVIVWTLKRWGLVSADADENTVEIRAGIIKPRFEELKWLYEEQERIQHLLDKLLKNKHLDKSEELTHFLNKHNRFLKLDVINGELEYIFTDSVLKRAMYGEDIAASIAKSLIAFLQSGQVEMLRKCRGCSVYFVADRRNKKDCNKKCRYAYHTREKVKTGRAAETMRRLRSEHPEKYI